MTHMRKLRRAALAHRFRAIAIGVQLVAGAFAQAQTAPQQVWFEVPPTVTLSTGDTWLQGAEAVRLYGVQACLRGSSVTVDGQRRDCGDISMVYLASLIREARPLCMHVAQTPNPPQKIVICRARIGSNTVDLGLALVTSGFAFAAYKPDGSPVSLEYVVAEEMAKKDRAGLWRYSDLPHPIPALLSAMRHKS